MSHGIVRRVDDLGRVVIPKDIRRALKIKEGDPLDIVINPDGKSLTVCKYVQAEFDWSQITCEVDEACENLEPEQAQALQKVFYGFQSLYCALTKGE